VKVIILAGGLGTRLSEYTESVPKPMVTVGGRPILWHIMKTYAHYGHKDFYIATGYKSEVIKEYFLNYNTLNSDFMVNTMTGKVDLIDSKNNDWQVTLCDTGLNSMTGGRVKRMKSFIGNEPFMLTYGDGVSNIDISELIKFHKNHGKMVTVSAVRPTARFGEIEMQGNKVISFQEKPQTSKSWINGGYFVIEPSFFDFINDDSTILEREPLEKAASIGELMAFHHEGYWQCMDTKRDRDSLNEMIENNNAPWTK